MKLRHKKTLSPCYSGSFNTCALSEILVYFDEGDADSDFISEYDVWLEKKQEWKDLRLAFQQKDVIIDNYNTRFFEPANEEERQRGFRE